MHLWSLIAYLFVGAFPGNGEPHFVSGAAGRPFRISELFPTV